MSLGLNKYLNTRAVTAPWQIEGCTRTDFGAAIVIPVLDEFTTLPQTLESIAKNSQELLTQTLILVVVNNRVSATTEQKRENRKTIDWLKSASDPRLNLAWVDSSSPSMELPQKDGVGLARKIGFDLALSRLDWSVDPLLISLDADTLIDGKYLTAINTHFEKSCCGGATLPFRHQQGETAEQEAAIRHYELYMRSYLFGLQQAGSPYAWHSIGSAIACRADAYIKAGGMNRRQAGEDFYFLQQLTKVAGVELISGTLVSPSARESLRVPFGTGRAVQAQVDDDNCPFNFVSVDAFRVLAAWLLLIEKNSLESGEVLLSMAKEISLELCGFLDRLDFVTVWQKLQSNHSGPRKRIQAFHLWFDGLRTRQLLRCFADNIWQNDVEGMVLELLEWGGVSARRETILDVLEAEQGVR